MDKLREMEMFGDDGRDGVWTVMANVMDPESLHRAFDGCAGVFHTSAFVDPAGMSGYTVSTPNTSSESVASLTSRLSRFKRRARLKLHASFAFSQLRIWHVNRQVTMITFPTDENKRWQGSLTRG
jgi:hypothetical protein